MEGISAEGSLDGALLSGEEILALATGAGYRPGAVSLVVSEADGDVPVVVSGWRKQPIWSDVTNDRCRDLGIGAGELNGTPLYVLLFGLSEEDAFAASTAALRDTKRVREELLAAVNRERAARNLPAVRRNAALDSAAEGHARDMLAREYYGHESPEGTNAYRRSLQAGYNPARVGENIAHGQTSIEEVMEDWMKSPVHRENILNPFFTEAGFGIAIGRMPSGYQVLWVQVFGRPQSR